MDEYDDDMSSSKPSWLVAENGKIKSKGPGSDRPPGPLVRPGKFDNP